MAEFIKIYNMELTVSANHCILIITIMPWLAIQLLLVTSPLTT